MIKKLLLILLCLPMIGFGQNVNIPDANFKAYLVGEPSININGDNEIQVSEATIFTGTINCANKSISSLTGIEYFTALTVLNCPVNQLTSLDVSSNTSLTALNCFDNQLTNINISANTVLWYLSCHDNLLTSLDVSGATALTQFYCFNNQLTSLDIRNGNNQAIAYFQSINNPNLNCINVDDAGWPTTNWLDIDPQHYFSNNCSGTSVEEHSSNKELLEVIGLLGRETKQTNQPLFYIYDDGTVEKRIVIE